MPSLNAFRNLDKIVRLAIINRCVARKYAFLKTNSLVRSDSTQFLEFVKGKVLLIGDRPAPSAPDDPEFHYTPFAALWNSSLWLNLKLHEAGVDEANLRWINSAEKNGTPTNYGIMLGEFSKVICLGGNAEKWLLKTGWGKAYSRVDHPAYWKRFHPKDDYPLIELLK
jgi:hypothetical protein